MNLPATGTLALLIVTVLATLFLNRTGGAILTWLSYPVRALWGYIYRRIAPWNPLSISVWNYKRSIRRSELAKIESPVGPPIDVLLGHSFVPLRVVSGSEQDRIDLLSFVADVPRVVVLGGPGTGKTTLMKNLVISVIDRSCDDRLQKLLPVFVMLRKMAAKNLTVRDALVAAFEEGQFPGAGEFVDAALARGRLIVVLDGLDEVGSNREAVVDYIHDFCRWDSRLEHRNRVIVTCREASYRTEDLRDAIPHVVRVEPFTPDHMRLFLARWPKHKDRHAIRLFAMIQDDPQIRQICSNPLLLTILAGLYLEIENFELPSSRERYYTAAIDELMVNRPARRSVKQKFDTHEKRRLLEAVSLERLENARPNEDSEEFTLAAIGKNAEAQISGKFELAELIYELVHVNGIIKPTREASFTCSHRTIQEYLAAREALRSRLSDQVVEGFGENPDLAEVVYFYCGLLTTIPILEQVIVYFVGRAKWRTAGRCALNATEKIPAPILQRIAEGLTTAEGSSGPELEILSALAQRRGHDFDVFRERLRRTIERLTGTDARNAVFGISETLVANPQLAMQLVPGLLMHDSRALRKIGIEVLAGIGTDTALDRLVQLLGDTADEHDRAEIAACLAGVMLLRPAALRAREEILPPRRSRVVWPLERYFPGRIAIPIAEAVAGRKRTENRLIDAAAEQVIRQPRLFDYRDRWRWSTLALRLSTATACQKFYQFCRKSLVFTYSYAAMLLVASVLLPQTGGSIVVRLWPPSMMRLPELDQTRMAADLLIISSLGQSNDLKGKAYLVFQTPGRPHHLSVWRFTSTLFDSMVGFSALTNTRAAMSDVPVEPHDDPELVARLNTAISHLRHRNISLNDPLNIVLLAQTNSILTLVTLVILLGGLYMSRSGSGFFRRLLSRKYMGPFEEVFILGISFGVLAMCMSPMVGRVPDAIRLVFMLVMYPIMLIPGVIALLSDEYTSLLVDLKNRTEKRMESRSADDHAEPKRSATTEAGPYSNL